MKYTLDQMQQLIRDADERMAPKHEHWRAMERLFATGSSRQIGEDDLASLYPGASGTYVVRAINMVLPHITLIENTIIQNEPDWLVYARGAGPLYPVNSQEEGQALEERAQVGKAVLSFFWSLTNASEDAADAVRDMVRLGSGFTKTLWNTQKVEIEKDDDELFDEKAQLVLDAQEQALETGTDLEEVLSEDEIESYVNATGERTVENRPVVAYVSPYNVRVPVDARKMDDVAWVAEIVTVRRDLAEETEAYTPFFDSGHELSTTKRLDKVKAQGQEADKVFEYVEIIEFWDLINRRLVHFQLDCDYPLLDTDIPWSHAHSPYTHYQNYKRNGDDFWGFGEIDNIASIQTFHSEILRAQVKDVKKAGRKYFVDKKYLTPEMRDGLRSEESDVAIPVNKPANTAWTEIFSSVERQGAAQETWEFGPLLEGHMRTTLGLNEFQAGMSGADRMSATAAAAVDGNAVVRVQEKLRNVERGLAHTGYLLLALAQEFLDETTAVRIGGVEAGRWLLVEPGDIDGDYGVKVDAGSTGAVNPATKAQRASELLELAPLIEQYAGNPALRPLLATALRGLGHNPDAILPPVEAVAAAPVQAPSVRTDQPQVGVNADSGHPVDSLLALGGAPVPAATEGDLAL